ncbi:MAG TPA: hypothetical protein VFS81_04100 [Candidatus Binatia bacterium]|nr:hypothetical protein [Candidatus Binatia bacterium]
MLRSGRDFWERPPLRGRSWRGQGQGAIDFIVLLFNLPHRIDPKRATTLLTLQSARHTTVFDCIAQSAAFWAVASIADCKLVPVAAIMLKPSLMACRMIEGFGELTIARCEPLGEAAQLLFESACSPPGGLFFFVLITRRGMWSS